MTDEEIVQFATDFRDGMLEGRSSAWMCAMVCWPLSTLLGMHGVDNVAVETDLGDMNHIWLRLADGRALDPTADQFNEIFPNMELPPVYLGEPLNIHGAAQGRKFQGRLGEQVGGTNSTDLSNGDRAA